MAKRTVWIAVTILIVASGAMAQQGTQNHFDGKTWWEYIKVLADDNMEGRETGSDGLRRAEAYVVEQLKKNGLEPAGSDGFYQPVKFESRQIMEKDSSAALVRDGKAETLTLGDDVLVGTRGVPGLEVNAPMVFVGYGLKIPEQNYDDLAGLDLKGKVVVYIAGSTEETPAALSAHYQSVAERWKVYRAAGVAGMISIPNPASMVLRISIHTALPKRSMSKTATSARCDGGRRRSPRSSGAARGASSTGTTLSGTSTWRARRCGRVCTASTSGWDFLLRIAASGAVIELDLSTAIDVAAERARYGRDLVTATKELEQTEKKLGNDGFLAKAPPDVVDGIRQRNAAALAEIARIKTALDLLPAQ